MVKQLEAERLVQEMNFPSELADLMSRSGVSQHLLRLKDTGFTVSESDPLLIIAVDVANPASISYFNNGNYGLPRGVPGGLPWPGGAPPAAEDPLPVGMATKSPVALGKFIAALDGVVELSLGANFAFYVKDNPSGRPTGSIFHIGQDEWTTSCIFRIQYDSLILQVCIAPAHLTLVPRNRTPSHPLFPWPESRYGSSCENDAHNQPTRQTGARPSASG